MRIAHAPRVADPVEELQDLDGALAPRAEGIAKARGIDPAVLARGRADDLGQLRDPLAIVEQIAHHLVNAALRDLLAQHLAHPLFGLVHAGGELAHPGRIEAPGRDQRLQLARQRLVAAGGFDPPWVRELADRKSTRLNSSHEWISY